MSIPFEIQDDRRFDRLVDGELPDGERRELLLRLETEPDGWRRCALAFLEAQSWRQTFAAVVAPAANVAVPSTASGKAKRWSAVRICALAACVALAFALGWAWHGRPTENAAQQTSETPPAVQVAGSEAKPKPKERSNPLDPLVKQYEQRGYRAERQNRLVSVELKDGRKVAVPVEEVRFQYVRGRTY